MTLPLPWSRNLLFAVAGICWAFSLTPVVAREDHKAGEIVIESTTPYELGTLYVPENRADPKSRIIGVGFARFRALKPTAAPPTFHLPGGPGGSLVKQSKSMSTYIGHFRSVSDVVFVDQRGYSERGEVLTMRAPAEPLDQPANLTRHTAAFVDAARAAVRDFTQKGIDLRGYTVNDCADDVNDLRKALGYERISLVGISFGSQWSFAIMRRHPGIVERALLGGVEPLNCGYDMPSHVLAAVQRHWCETEKDARLQPYLPPGGLMAAARDVLQRLERAPITVKLADGKTVTLGPEDFQKHFLTLAADPSLLLSLYHERAFETWARDALARRRNDRDMPLIGPLIDTSLGVTPKREYLLRTDPATPLLGQWNFAGYLATADTWPTADVGDALRSEVVTDIPVVFAQGDWDTSTPVENLLEVVPYFRKSRVMLLERGGHGALWGILHQQPKTTATLLEFLKTGATEQLPARVTLPAPKFAVPSFPPPG